MNLQVKCLGEGLHQKQAQPHGGLVVFFSVFLGISFLIRLALLAQRQQCNEVSAEEAKRRFDAVAPAGESSLVFLREGA